jgi:hypothetical protein
MFKIILSSGSVKSFENLRLLLALDLSKPGRKGSEMPSIGAATGFLGMICSRGINVIRR